MKQFLQITLFLGFILPSTSYSNFVNQSQPEVEYNKIFRAVGMTMAATGYWLLLNETATRTIKNYNNVTKKIEFNNVPKDKIGIFLSASLLGTGIAITLSSIYTDYKTKKWNSRTEDQVYTDAQGTYEHIIKALEPVYAITGDNLDIMLPEDQRQEIVIKLKKINKWIPFPLAYLYCGVYKKNLLLYDHAKALQAKIDTYILARQSDKIPAQWFELIELMLKELAKHKKLLHFIAQSV